MTAEEEKELKEMADESSTDKKFEALNKKGAPESVAQMGTKKQVKKQKAKVQKEAEETPESADKKLESQSTE